MDRESLQVFLDAGLSLQQIGDRVGCDPSTVAYWVRKHGLEAVHRERHAARGGIARDQLARLVDEGLSVTQMAGRLSLSRSTVRHWLARYELETRRAAQLRAGRAGRRDGRAIVIRLCRVHGETEYYLEGRGAYRCLKCRSERVVRRRRKARETLIAEAGGACAICGYARYLGALQFHHLDPTRKSFTVRSGVTIGLDRLREEARKCVLLCANCHAEVEGGVARVPSPIMS